MHRDALKNSSFFFSPSFFFLLNDFKNHKKTGFSFRLFTRLQKRRARQANAPERLHHHHQQHHHQQQRSASFSRRARKSARFFSAVARVFSSSSSIGCFCVLFVQTKRDSSSLVRGSGGACFGSEKNQIEVPRSCAFPVLRFRSARRRERAHRLERDRA